MTTGLRVSEYSVRVVYGGFRNSGYPFWGGPLKGVPLFGGHPPKRLGKGVGRALRALGPSSCSLSNPSMVPTPGQKTLNPKPSTLNPKPNSIAKPSALAPWLLTQKSFAA